MELVAKRPIIEMTKEELQTIRSFLKIIDNKVFDEYGWSDFIEDFPREDTCDEKYIEGDIYDIEIVN